jgi:hypothetical protein
MLLHYLMSKEIYQLYLLIIGLDALIEAQWIYLTWIFYCLKLIWLNIKIFCKSKFTIFSWMIPNEDGANRILSKYSCFEYLYLFIAPFIILFLAFWLFLVEFYWFFHTILSILIIIDLMHIKYLFLIELLYWISLL